MRLVASGLLNDCPGLALELPAPARRDTLDALRAGALVAIVTPTVVASCTATARGPSDDAVLDKSADCSDARRVQVRAVGRLPPASATNGRAYILRYKKK